MRAATTVQLLLLVAVCSAASPLWAQDRNRDLGKDRSAEPSVAGSESIALPDSPGVLRAQLSTQSPGEQADSAQSQNTQTAPAQPNSAQTSNQQPAPQKPVGTAVAEPSGASGVAASQPAGAAIAPAKQRRVRTIILRVGAIIGAGVAVGTIVALTEGTSSKPPGAH